MRFNDVQDTRKAEVRKEQRDALGDFAPIRGGVK